MSTDGTQSLSLVDTFWLRQDRPYNHMTISSVMVLAERMDLKRLQHLIETRWCAFSRFKQRPVSHATGVYWETDTHFDIGNHVRRIGLPGAQGKEELEELVSNLVTMPLDLTKLLWDLHLIEDYQGGSAVVWRIHHCYGDGIALIQVVLSITEKAPDNVLTITSRPPLDAQRHEDEEVRTDIFRQVLEPVSEALRQAVNTGRDLLGEGVDIVLHPAQAVDQAHQGIGTILGYARQGLGFVSEATRLLFLADDPPTRFKGKLGGGKASCLV